MLTTTERMDQIKHGLTHRLNYHERREALESLDALRQQVATKDELITALEKTRGMEARLHGEQIEALRQQVAEMERALREVDDVLIVNWVGPRKDGDYRQALAALVTSALQEHEWATVEKLTEERDAAVSANRCELEGHKLTIADHRRELAERDARTETLEGALRKALEWLGALHHTVDRRRFRELVDDAPNVIAAGEAALRETEEPKS